MQSHMVLGTKSHVLVHQNVAVPCVLFSLSMCKMPMTIILSKYWSQVEKKRVVLFLSVCILSSLSGFGVESEIDEAMTDNQELQGKHCDSGKVVAFM